jgi:predicted Rossmann-fold nucleotide-binding protein
VKEDFVRPENRELILVASTAEEMLEKLEAWEPPGHIEKWMSNVQR